MSLERLKAERDAWREAFIAIRQKLNEVATAAAAAAGALHGVAESVGEVVTQEHADLALQVANDLWCPDTIWAVDVPMILKADPEFFSPAECN